jgi:AcrR family transcriptional regulator
MPRIVDPDKVRAALLDRCIALFANQGFSGLTMRRLAKALGVSTGTLYHYFSNKEALFAGVVQAVANREIQAAMSALPETIDDPVALLLDYVEANETRMVQQFLVLLEYLRAQADDPKTADARRALMAYQTQFFETLGTVLGIEDPRAAQAVFYFLRGLTLQRHLDGGATSLRAHEPTLRALVAS